MRHLALATALVLLATPVLAADITVFSPGISSGPLRKLAAEWTAQTSNKVTLAGANVGRIRTAVGNDTPADLVIAPTSDFTDFAPKLTAGSEKKLGRILFGVVVKKGGPKPDISTPAKFEAEMKKAGVLAYADPASGSLSGTMVQDMLKRPQFAGIAPRPIKGMIADAIVRGDAVFGGGAISEQLLNPDAEIIGPFPDSLGVYIDLSIAVLKVAAAPSEAQAFLAYITRPEAAPVWKAGGIAETP